MAALPLSAHHSFAAEYDNSKPVCIKGKAVKMDWVNPHSHLIFEVTAPDGKTEQWTAETPPPIAFSGAYLLAARGCSGSNFVQSERCCPDVVCRSKGQREQSKGWERRRLR